MVGFDRKSKSAASFEESLTELRELAATAGAEVLEVVTQIRDSPTASTLVGQGKVEELRAQAAGSAANVVIFDHELTPTQQRNLEKQLEIKVLDRTQLILDIFASRARTREGRLQVELAQLSYLLPRLTGQGVELSRLGGGIGTRGPGETKLETDRRRIAKRIKKLESNLEQVRASRGLHRDKRLSVPLPTVALVGYTNAGKSTLFNRLTKADVVADARMFATLDPTIRGMSLPSRRRVLLSDTVGFIRNLPTTLVKAFRATLEEVAEAALILHVVDIASPQAVAHTTHVLQVLTEIHAAETPQILVLNKSDLLPAEDRKVDLLRARLLSESGGRLSPTAVLACAQTGFGLSNLLAEVDAVIPFDPVVSANFEIPLCDPASIALLHNSSCIQTLQYRDDFCLIRTNVSESLMRRLNRYLATSVN